MVKKYFPLIALLAAAMLLFWVKKNQRGEKEQIDIAVDLPSDTGSPFTRDTALLMYSKHALCRMECRHIDEYEVKELLLEGKLNKGRIEEGPKGITYPLEGITRDRQHVRLVVAPGEDKIVVVTVIDLEKDWPCNCN